MESPEPRVSPHPDALTAFFLDALSPIDPADLGRGARILVPDGLSFGALQAARGGRFHDWFRNAPDRHFVPRSRHALHLGVDLAFFVRARRVHMLPAELPVRALADGVVAAAHGAGCEALEPGGIIIVHGPPSQGERARGGALEAQDVRPFSYLGDVREARRPGERVVAGEVIARTIAQRARRGPERVVVHLGIGLSIPGHGLEFLDPCVLLRRWGVRHPVFPGSTCTPARLRSLRPGRWVEAGRIEGAESKLPASRGLAWNPRWRTRW